jgi:hypothetical protein
MWRAIRRGLADSIKFPAPLLLMFVIYLIGALMLALPIFSGLNQTFSLSCRLASGDLARTFDVITLVEPGLAARSLLAASPVAANAPTPDPTGMLAGLLMSTAMLLALVLGVAVLASLPNTLVCGGALRVYADGRFTWRRFLWGCWHWALPFVVLLIVFSAIAASIAVLGLMVAAVLAALNAGGLVAPALMAVIGLYLATMVWFDYARAIAVSQNRRNIFWALAQAFRFVIRQPARAFGLYLLLMILGYLLIVVYNRMAAPLVPFGWALAAIGLQQAFVAAQLWTRLARWASVLALYHERQVEWKGI